MTRDELIARAVAFAGTTGVFWAVLEPLDVPLHGGTSDSSG
jgi:hypothetical protein